MLISWALRPSVIFGPKFRSPRAEHESAVGTQAMILTQPICCSSCELLHHPSALHKNTPRLGGDSPEA